MAAVRTPEPAARRGAWRRLSLLRHEVRTAAWRTRLTAGLTGAALTVTALGTLVALATDARPGDVLYGLKRGTEQTQLALAGDDRGATLLEFAGTRLDELAALTDRSPAVVVDVLDTMDAQTVEGASLLATRAVSAADAAPADQLADWAARQDAELAALRPAVPGGAAAATGNSLELLAEVTRRAADLRTAVACPGGPATRGSDELGPVPVACPEAAPPSGVDEDGTGAPGSPAPESAAVPGTAPSSPTAPAPAPPAQGAPPATGSPTSPAPGSAPGTGTAPAPDRGGATPSTPPGPPASTPAPLPLPLPLPPRGGPPGSSSPPAPVPPLIDTPLPVCIPLLVC
nr:DUF5667 domain-containing protein [Geodermatophilus sabuli]